MQSEPISRDVLALVRAEVLGSSHGLRSRTLKKWSQILGYSTTHLWRMVTDPAEKRQRAGIAVKQDLHAWTDIVFQIKKKPPQEAGELSTEQAARLCVEAGLLPPEAAEVPAGTFDRIGRLKGLNKKQKRIVRFQAQRPNEAHHFDASSSAYFYVKKIIGDDYLLALHRPAKHYKNKPIPCNRLRPWAYGLVDDHSGKAIARYCAAEGESASDSLMFLQHAWSIIGLPEQLLADQGMLKKAFESSDFIKRLDIELPQMKPYAKEGHGKIERPWRTLWQRFERPFFAAVADWAKFEILMSELNRHAENYLLEYNDQPHRYFPDRTREQAWQTIAWHGGIVKIPEHALATVAKRKRRKVDPDGTIEYEGKVYEVRGLHDTWVWVYEGVFDDRLVAQEIDSGRRFDMSLFAPLQLGQFRAFPETPHQHAVKAGLELVYENKALLYGDQKTGVGGQGSGRDATNIVTAPIKETVREIEDVLDASCYGSIAEAMREFYRLSGVAIDAEQAEAIEELIVKKNREKDFVAALAEEVREAAANSKSVQAV